MEEKLLSELRAHYLKAREDADDARAQWIEARKKSRAAETAELAAKANLDKALKAWAEGK